MVGTQSVSLSHMTRQLCTALYATTFVNTQILMMISICLSFCCQIFFGTDNRSLFLNNTLLFLLFFFVAEHFRGKQCIRGRDCPLPPCSRKPVCTCKLIFNAPNRIRAKRVDLILYSQDLKVSETFSSGIIL